MSTKNSLDQLDVQLKKVFTYFPNIELAMLLGHQRADSDLDIAVMARKALTVDERIAIVSALAERIGRPVDLVDLHGISEPLLGQIVRYGRRVLGSDKLYGELIARHMFEQAGFMPYRARLLAERRAA